jgi:5-dehydro-2-deoxygluconokinase
MLGLDAPAAELARVFKIAAAETMVRGFAVGRTIFGDPARAWLAGRIDDAAAIDEMAERFAGLVAAWDGSPGLAGPAEPVHVMDVVGDSR